MKRRWRLWPWWTISRRLSAGVFFALLLLAGSSDFPWIKGSTAATTFFGVVPVVDPLAALECLIAAHSLPATVLFGAGLTLGGALLLGPVFCGWICPLGLLFDLQHSVRRKVLHLFRVRRARVPLVIPPVTRYLVLGVTVGVTLGLGIPLFQALSPIHLLLRGLVFGLTGSLLVLAGIAALELCIPRLWCRSFCPLGALYGLIGRFGIFRIRINPALAGRTPCQQCTRSCPMGIDVMGDYTMVGAVSVDHPDCIRCGECVDICPTTVLRLGFRPPTSDADPPCPHRYAPEPVVTLQITVECTDQSPIK